MDQLAMAAALYALGATAAVLGRRRWSWMGLVCSVGAGVAVWAPLWQWWMDRGMVCQDAHDCALQRASGVWDMLHEAEQAYQSPVSWIWASQSILMMVSLFAFIRVQAYRRHVPRFVVLAYLVIGIVVGRSAMVFLFLGELKVRPHHHPIKAAPSLLLYIMSIIALLLTVLLHLFAKESPTRFLQTLALIPLCLLFPSARICIDSENPAKTRTYYMTMAGSCFALYLVSMKQALQRHDLLFLIELITCPMQSTLLSSVALDLILSCIGIMALFYQVDSLVSVSQFASLGILLSPSVALPLTIMDNYRSKVGFHLN